MKKTQLEANIKALQRKIAALEESGSSLHQSLDELPGNLSLASEKPVQVLRAPEASDELENLRKTGAQAMESLENLHYRCEGLQSSLTLKLDALNRATLELADKHAVLSKLQAQQALLEAELQGQKNGLLPEHRRLKASYAIALLDLKNLELDNGILDAKIKELASTNTELKNEQRELKTATAQSESDRLSLKKEIETIKSEFAGAQSEFSELRDKFDAQKNENENLRNSLYAINQKLAAAGAAEKVSPPAGLFDVSAAREKLARRKSVTPGELARSTPLGELDKLNLDGVLNFENEIRRLGK